MRRFRLNPVLAEAYTNRGIVKSELGKHKEAIVDYDKAIRLNRDAAEPYINRGLAKCRLGKVVEAKADFQTALEIAERQGRKDLKTTIEKMIQELKDKK